MNIPELTCVGSFAEWLLTAHIPDGMAAYAAETKRKVSVDEVCARHKTNLGFSHEGKLRLPFWLRVEEDFRELLAAHLEAQKRDCSSHHAPMCMDER